MKKFILTTLIWFGFATTIFLLWQQYSADVHYKKAQNYVQKGKFEEALAHATKSVKQNPREPNYYRVRAKVNTVRVAEKQAILSDLEQAYKLNPNNLVTTRNSIPLYYFLAIRDVSLPPSQENTDDIFVVITESFFMKVKGKYVKDAGVIAELAKYEKKLGMGEEYIKSVGIIKNLRPDLLEWHESFR